MATCFKQLGVGLLVTFFLLSCTDGRRPKQIQIYQPEPAPQTDMVLVGEAAFDDSETEVQQISIQGSSLFMTGKPFGFARYDIGANAENPNETFVVARQLNEFSSFGAWIVDMYASGGMAFYGPMAFMSGTAGLSIVDISETHAPREVRRIPRENEGTDPEKWVRDDALVYTAMVSHPTLPLLYGFREQDFVYTLIVGQGTDGLKLGRKDAYAPNGGTVCCVDGATIWNGKMFVAFRSKLVFFDIGPNGELINAVEIHDIQATNVVSTANHLYVQHDPTYAQPEGTVHPKGIYVFNTSGRQVARLNSNSPIVFAVSQNDDYIYANDDNTQLSIYKISWIY